MRRTVFVLLLVLVFQPFVETLAGKPSQRAFKVRKEDSHVGFSITKWLVVKEEGRFREVEGEIEYDPQNPAATKVRLVIKTTSIDSRNAGRDRALRSEEFLHVEKHPLMTFSSTSVSASSKDQLNVEGDITLRGVTKRITVPVKVLGVNYAGREIGHVAGFESTFVLNREEFGVAKGWDALGKEVTVTLLIGANSISWAAVK
jgi:polyisoprenoid-binding protein YceI